MNRYLPLGLTLAVALALAPASAFAQAAAESVLLNANSAAATVKGASALGSALNRATRQLAGTVQQVSSPVAGKTAQAVPRPVSTRPPKATAIAAGSTATGPMITSINGAVPNCSQVSPPRSTPDHAVAISAPPACAVASSSNPARVQEYKSVVTVTFK
jgi:hypothetical protein